MWWFGKFVRGFRSLLLFVLVSDYSPFRPLILPVWKSMELPVTKLLNAPTVSSANTPESECRDYLTTAWRETKLRELSMIGLIGSISSAAITGCFSLYLFQTAHWATQGLFFGGLFISIMTLVTVLQQTTTLYRIGGDTYGLAKLRRILTSQYSTDGGQAAPSMLQIYVWQTPILLLNFTLIIFLLGLTLLVLPLVEKNLLTLPAANFAKVFGPIAIFALLNYAIPTIFLVLAVDKAEKEPNSSLPGPNGHQNNGAVLVGVNVQQVGAKTKP
ncbi:hypothetical protein V8E51_013055 [Hyaloscypha variabilis]